MRIVSVFLRRIFPCLAAAGLPLLCCGASQPDNVLLQYHFVGATELAKSPDIMAARNVFSTRITYAYLNMVLNVLTEDALGYLAIPTNTQSMQSLGNLWGDVLTSESLGSVGAAPGQPLDFVLAIKLNPARLKEWQHNLTAINNGPGEELRAGSFAGRQWNGGRKEGFWFVPAQDWLVVGQGDNLKSVRNDCLEQIQKTGRPQAALAGECFRADADWPRLAEWNWLSTCPFKLGRMKVDISATMGAFNMTCKVTYGESIPWQPQPTRIPTELVREPLSSFATGQNVEPFLKSDDTLAALNNNPLRSQFYFWSMGEMPLQSYVAWPDDNPKESLKQFAPGTVETLNPGLKALNGSELEWRPNQSQLLWTKLSLATPLVQPAPEGKGSFMVGGLFPITPGRGPAPDALWQNIQNRSDLVYYDWELTGPRLLRLVAVTQILPILQTLGIGPKPGAPAIDAATRGRLKIEEDWLASLNLLLGTTVTQITKTGPAELTINRNSPFVFSSLELILLSHLLVHTPAGPLDMNLFPHPKMTGPGMPRR